MVAQQILVLLVQVRALVEQRRGCVKIGTPFFMHKAPTFTSWGFVIT